MRLTSLMAIVALLGAAGPATAQPTPAEAADHFEIADGFAPDPQILDVTAGGNVNAAIAAGKQCAGYVSEEATLRLTVSIELPLLYLYASSERPTTLNVLDPEGTLLCDHGYGGSRDPLIAIDAPMAGDYLVWVGGITASEAFEAALLLATATIGPSLDPIYGQSEFAAGAERNGLENNLVAGGLLPAASADATCSGYVTAAPTYSYTYTPGAFSLAAQVGSDADTVLLIRDPEGGWHCDDDSAGDGNPLLTIDDPPAGRYDFWLGTTSPATPAERPEDSILSGLVEWFIGDGAGAEATLYFFEFSPGCTLEPTIPGAQRC